MILDTQARIERPVLSHDAYGGAITLWETVATPMCEVRDELPSRVVSEAVKNGIVNAAQRARLRMRWRAGITSDMRVIMMRPDRRAYQIVSGPAELGRRDGLELMIEEWRNG